MPQKKPSQEELDKTIKEAEDLKGKPEPEEDNPAPDPKEDPPKEDPKPEDEDPKEDPPEEGDDDDSEEEDPKDPPKEDDDDFEDLEDDGDEEDDPDPEEDPKPEDKDKRYKESTKENQRIRARTKLLDSAIDEEIAEPTDEEMKQEYPNWDDMDEVMQDLAKEAVMNKKFRTNLQKAREEGKKIDNWNQKVVDFIENPETLTKNPDLEGRLEEFMVFATSDTHRDVAFDLLVPAFLHNSVPKTKNKGQMFPKGSAGSKEKRKPRKLSVEEGRKLRETDYNKWKRLLKAGKIATI